MKKRIIAALVLALVLLLVIPAALAAEPDGTARFYLNGTQYRVEPDGESGQIVLAWNDEDGDWSEEPTSLPTGVSYDLKSNTLTLNGAQLETADFRYTLAGDDGMEYWLPKANLTIKLVGENSISLSPSEIDPDQSYHALAFGGGIHATMEGDGTLAVSTVASHDGSAILVCEESLLVLTDQAKVTAEVTGTYQVEDEEGNPFETVPPAVNCDYSSLTLQGSAQLTAEAPTALTVHAGSATVSGSAKLIANGNLEFNGEESDQSNFTVMENGQVSVTTDGEMGINLYEANLVADGGELDLHMTASDAYREDVDDNGNPIYTDYIWTNGILCGANSRVSLQGGDVSIKIPNGTAIYVGSEEGTGSFLQSGGTLTISASEGSVESNGIYSEWSGSIIDFQGGTATIRGTSQGIGIGEDASLTVRGSAKVTLESYRFGIGMSGSLEVTGGLLDIDMKPDNRSDTGYAPSEEEDEAEIYPWCQGIACGDGDITISGGTLDISFPNGTGIGFGGEGGSSLVQTGGTLDVTATERVDSVCLELFQMSGGHTTLTFRGGETNLTGHAGMTIGIGNVVTLEQGADVSITSEYSQGYYDACAVEGTLNVYGGSLTVNSVDAYALWIFKGGAYNQSGGSVTLTTTGYDAEHDMYPHGLFADHGSSTTISGGTLNATSDYTGMALRGDFTLLGGTVTATGDLYGTVVENCNMQLRGGSLQAQLSGDEGAALMLVPNEGTALTVTGGSHSFLAPEVAAEGKITQGLRSISAPVSFQGGSVRMTGKTAMVWYGEMGENGTTDDGVNQITLSGGMHAVSNDTGNELTMLQFTQEGTTTVPGEEGKFEYTVYEYYCTEDNTVGGTVCTDLTVSAVAGEIPVGYTGSMEVISGQATVGAPVVIQYTVATQGTVSITLPDGLDYIEDSLSVNGQAQDDLDAIEVDGSAVILFSVKPMATQSLTVTAGVTTAEGSYQETCAVKASGFDITAPTYTKVSEIRVSGRGTPGDVVTLEITGENNNRITEEIEVTELGTFAAAVELPVEDPKVAELFNIKVYVGTNKVDTLSVQYDPDTSTVTYLSITNVVHNNKGDRVSLTVDVDYLADAAQQSYYTYWPDEDLFTFEVTFDGTVTDAKVLVTLQDGTVKEVELDPTTDPKVWTGELELTDPSNPPVRYQVGWNTGAYEALSSAHTFMPIMDPSGVVYSGSLDTPVAGATVTLLYGGNGTNPGTASVFDMEPFDQVNPQITDALGNYGWNVPEGWWKIRATYVQNGKTYTVESQWLHVQPVQTGVNLDLDLPVKPTLPGGILLPGLVGGDDGFRDVAESAYYYDAVEWAVDKGVTEGTGSGKFSPDRACTRGEIVAFLYRAAGCPVPVSEENPFTDVHQGDYYYDAVLWAVEQGITQGTSKTTFSPGTTCTRAQAVTFLYRYFASPATSAALSFTDVPASAYYYNAVRWAVSGGITQGTGKNTFRPDKTCTRAEIVTFLYRAMA